MKKIKMIVACILIVLVSMGTCPMNAKADGGLACSVGKDYGPDDKNKIDTREDAKDAFRHYSDAGYTAKYITNPLKSELYKAMDGVAWINADILLFSGHGSSTGMNFGFRITAKDLKTVKSGDIDIAAHMPHVKLVTFAGCETALGAKNITKSAVEYGAETAVGWTDTVYGGSHSNWLCRYNNRLAEGDTVEEAVDFANSFIYLPGSGVKTVVIEGNEDLKITGAENSWSTWNGGLRETTKVMYSCEEDIANLVEEIRLVDQSFDLQNYKIYEYNRGAGDFVIDFVKVIDGCETLSGYTAIVTDGYLTELYDNTIPRDDIKEMSTVVENAVGLDELEQGAMRTSMLYSGKRIHDVSEREYHYLCDIETGKKYLSVLSECEYAEGETELQSIYYELQ